MIKFVGKEAYAALVGQDKADAAADRATEVLTKDPHLAAQNWLVEIGLNGGILIQKMPDASEKTS